MLDARPKISVLIATFNAEGTLDRCLDSLLAQTFRGFEVLVADGGSTDGTAAILSRRSAELAYWHSHPDQGIYDAWNQLLRRARGEYICFMGADDAFFGPETLLRLAAAVDGGHYELVSSRGELRDRHWRRLTTFGGPWDFAKAPRRMGVCHPGLLHHHSLFRRFGEFDARYRIAGDLDFLLRLPDGLRTLDLGVVTVATQDDGVSRRAFWRRLKERRQIHACCPRVGPVMAWIYWLDKAWRRPIARMLGLPH